MTFAVHLLRVPPLDSLTGWEVFDLMVNARHIAGDYWCFEGDVEGLLVGGKVELLETSATEAHGHLQDDEFHRQCDEIFGSIDMTGEDPAWKMLARHKYVLEGGVR